MSPAKSKEASDPGIAGPIVIGVLCALIGAGLGFFQLMGGEPEVIEMGRRRSSSAQEEEASPPSFLNRQPVVVQALRGPRSGGNYEAKRRAVLEGQYPLTIQASELNAWSRRYFRVQAPEEGGMLYIVPEAPAFWVSDGVFHVSMGLDITVGGQTRSALFIARGSLQGGSNGLTFVPAEMYLGRAKVPPIGGFKGILQGLVMKVFSESEEFQSMVESLGRVSDVQMAEGQIILSS